MTDKGLEIPPVQKASHILSTCDFNSPVIIKWYVVKIQLVIAVKCNKVTLHNRGN